MVTISPASSVSPCSNFVRYEEEMEIWKPKWEAYKKTDSYKEFCLAKQDTAGTVPAIFSGKAAEPSGLGCNFPPPKTQTSPRFFSVVKAQLVHLLYTDLWHGSKALGYWKQLPRLTSEVLLAQTDR